MNGTFAMPKIARPDASLSDPGPPYLRTIKYDHAIIQPTRLAVMRASQIHHVPHERRAHSGPVTSVMAPNSTVSSAAAAADRSWRGLPPNRKRRLATPQTIADSRNIQADGMW